MTIFGIIWWIVTEEIVWIKVISETYFKKTFKKRTGLWILEGSNIPSFPHTLFLAFLEGGTSNEIQFCLITCLWKLKGWSSGKPFCRWSCLSSGLRFVLCPCPFSYSFLDLKRNTWNKSRNQRPRILCSWTTDQITFVTWQERKSSEFA